MCFGACCHPAESNFLPANFSTHQMVSNICVEKLTVEKVLPEDGDNKHQNALSIS
jgi:hypothetical protein